VQLHKLFWYDAQAQLCTGLTIEYTSVKQGCMQVLRIRIILQTPLHLLLPSTMFIAMLGPHLFFGNAAWQSRLRRVRIQPT
jgi:hypothetical protein